MSIFTHSKSRVRSLLNARGVCSPPIHGNKGVLTQPTEETGDRALPTWPAGRGDRALPTWLAGRGRRDTGDPLHTQRPSDTSSPLSAQILSKKSLPPCHLPPVRDPWVHPLWFSLKSYRGHGICSVFCDRIGLKLGKGGESLRRQVLLTHSTKGRWLKTIMLNIRNW